MINIPILKKNFREHIWLWGIVTAVLVLYLFLLLGTYAPDGKAGVILLFSGLPSAVQTALGAGNYGLSLSGILGGYFWENIFTLVPFVFSIPVAASFRCRQTGKRCFLLGFLSAPVEREKLLFTQIYSFYICPVCIVFCKLSGRNSVRPGLLRIVFCDFRVLTDVPWRILPAFLPWGPAVCDICNV